MFVAGASDPQPINIPCVVTRAITDSCEVVTALLYRERHGFRPSRRYVILRRWDLSTVWQRRV